MQQQQNRNWLFLFSVTYKYFNVSRSFIEWHTILLNEVWCMEIRKSYFDFIWHCIYSISWKYNVQCTMELGLDFWTTIQNSIRNNGNNLCCFCRYVSYIHSTSSMYFIQINIIECELSFQTWKKSTVKSFFRCAVYSLCIHCLTHIFQTVLDCFTYKIRIKFDR